MMLKSGSNRSQREPGMSTMSCDKLRHSFEGWVPAFMAGGIGDGR
jgi:hypothetical protein